MIFAGDEWGATGSTGEAGRIAMPWHHPDQQNEQLYNVYRDLIRLRGRYRALTDGGLRWVLQEDDAVAYLRETNDETILIFAARAPWVGAAAPPIRGLNGAQLIHGTADLVRDDDMSSLHFPEIGPTFSVWKV